MLIKYIGKRYPKPNSKQTRHYGLFRCDKCGIEAERIMHKKTDSSFICKKCSSTKHGLYYSRIYKIWIAMIARCHSKTNYKYKYYGEKGVFVCDEWRNDFMSFYNWSMVNGYDDLMTIDKDTICEKENIHPKTYSPKTCIWITRNKNNEEARGRQSKKVGQYSKDGVLINIYKSVLDASKKTNIYQANINSVTLNKRKTAGGFLWKDLS